MNVKLRGSIKTVMKQKRKKTRFRLVSLKRFRSLVIGTADLRVICRVPVIIQVYPFTKIFYRCYERHKPGG